MKKVIYVVAAILSLQANAGGSDVNSGNTEKTLECYRAIHPEDATIVYHNDNFKVIKSESAQSLKINITQHQESDTVFQNVRAWSKSMIYTTGAFQFENTRAQIECDGGGWTYQKVDGFMVIANVNAEGEVKNTEGGCVGAGTLKADKPILLKKVTCE